MLTLNSFRRMRAPVAAITLAATQACYAYVPLVGSARPTVGERVRVTLTSSGTTELARYLGPGVEVAEGRLSSASGDGTLVVAVDFVQTLNGIRQPWTGVGLVSFPSEHRREVHMRTFQKQRSIVAGVLGAAALVGIAVAALKIAGSGEGGGDGGGQPTP